jgi:hypothetical protein
MTTETERAKKLADDHLSWVAGYNKALGLTMIPMAAAEYLYRTAIAHGVGHGIEMERNGEFRPTIGPDLTAEEIANIIGAIPLGSGLANETQHPLHPEDVERISGAMAKTPPLCVSCTLNGNECEHSGETVKWCGHYTSSLRERIAEAKEPQALDLSLPSIMLECTAEEAHRKYAEENAEWLTTDIGTMEELIERWDCLQALNTYLDRGGDAAFVMDEINYITHDLKAYAAKGAKLMEAKAAAILKNAKRGYYSPEVNQIIIASNGERWK